MPTVEEFIPKYPTPLNVAGAHQQIVSDLFDNLCFLAKLSWKYAAGFPQIMINTVLTSDSLHPWQFNCQRLTDLFVQVVLRYFHNVLGVDPFPLGIETINKKNLVSASGLECFDANVVGNVCTATQTVSQVRRCLFLEHSYVRIGATYYDPTFCTPYAAPDGVVGCQLDGGPTTYSTRGPKSAAAVKIFSLGLASSEGKFCTGTEGGTQYVFVKTGYKSTGFGETFRMVARNELSDEEKSRMGLP